MEIGTKCINCQNEAEEEIQGTPLCHDCWMTKVERPLVLDEKEPNHLIVSLCEHRDQLLAEVETLEKAIEIIGKRVVQ